jgi:hypothetical protein
MRLSFRIGLPLVGLSLFALCASAQVGQLGVKGRQRETVRRGPTARTETPTHRLPSRGAAGELVFEPNADEVERQRLVSEAPPAHIVPDDRTHRLVRRLPAAAPPLPGRSYRWPYDRPRRFDEGDPIAGLLPQFRLPANPELETEAVKNRWKISQPDIERYENTDLDAIYTKPKWFDPFNKNPLKGDIPVFGNRWFANFTGVSDTLLEMRRVPTTNAVSTANPDSFDFFGDGEQSFVRQSFRTSIELFRGSAGFRPVDFSFKFTPEFNINYLSVRENNVVNIDPREGVTRLDTHVGLQEMFVETRLGTNGVNPFRRGRRDFDDRGDGQFDFSSLRVGIQRFTSDFRGFIFSDEQPGARLFGTFRNNKIQYNLAYFNLLEKDTNSGLNSWRMRNQSVYVANIYFQDLPALGYNLNFSLHYNNDQPSFQLDNNGFLARPSPIGDPLPHKVRAGYIGTAGEGHIGRYNMTHALYYAFGRDDRNPIVARPQNIRAYMAALELSYEVDWRIYKLSFFHASGDGDLSDGKATGFDSIVDNPQFAGGGFLGNAALADRGLINPLFEGGGVNLLNRQTIPLTAAGVALFSFNSLLPSLRSNKLQGQASFVNPGITLVNAGVDAKLTPKLRSTFNVNYLRFDRTEVLEAVLFQSGIKHSIGVDVAAGLQYRPFLNDNFVITGGFGVLLPGAGLAQIYPDKTLYSGFLLTRFLF